MNKLNVLCGCEESQEVCKAFRKMGHNAFSCDIDNCSGGFPEWHLKIDIRKAIKMKKWDIIILFCPCTYTCLSGNRWYYNSKLRKEGAIFTKQVYELACSVCDKVALEQPKTVMQNFIGKKSQSIQPWQFGHGETKDTWLWLKNLPLLVPTKIINVRKQRVFFMSPSKNRGKLRSKTFSGIAKAMAEQWGQ